MGTAAFQLIPFAVVSIALGFGNAFLAAKTGRSRALWFVLSVIPVANVIATYFMIYSSIAFAIDSAKR